MVSDKRVSRVWIQRSWMSSAVPDLDSATLWSWKLLVRKSHKGADQNRNKVIDDHKKIKKNQKFKSYTCISII